MPFSALQGEYGYIKDQVITVSRKVCPASDVLIIIENQDLMQGFHPRFYGSHIFVPAPWILRCP